MKNGDLNAHQLRLSDILAEFYSLIKYYLCNINIKLQIYGHDHKKEVAKI